MNLENILIYVQDRSSRKYLITNGFRHSLEWVDSVKQYKIRNKLHLDILTDQWNNHIITFFNEIGLIQDKEKIGSIMFFLKLQLP